MQKLSCTLLRIGFKVLQGPHVGDVYRTQISLGLSWYNFLKAYCGPETIRIRDKEQTTITKKII